MTEHNSDEARTTAAIEAAYRAEHETALLYEALAVIEPSAAGRAALETIAAEELAQAERWANELAQAGKEIPAQQLSVAARALVWLAMRSGTRSVAPLLVWLQEREGDRYLSALPDPELALEERRHAQILRALGRGDADPLSAPPWSESEGFNLRAAIFGMNDGLISTLSLTAGLAGAQVPPEMVALGGATGLLAGALSMACGEYISVRSQQELMEHRFRTRRQELEKAPGGALRLLAATHQSRGLSVEEAEQVAKALLAGTSQADRPELAGLGSPFAAAASSFAAFAVGAAIPLWPYLIVGPFALLVSVAGSALTLAGVGALLAPSSGRNLWFSAARMLSIGGAAAAVTYTAGRIFDLRTM